MKINRTNWKEFRQEPPLTEKEIGLWNQMAGECVKNDALFQFLENETESLLMEARKAPNRSGDWSDVVEWADANRRLQRAEIAAYLKWKGEANHV